jgi:hypothetical protein
MQAYEEEEAGIVAGETEQMMVVEPGTEVPGADTPALVGSESRVSNWRYFWAGESVRGRENGGQEMRQGAVDVESGQGRRGRGWRVWRRG